MAIASSVLEGRSPDALYSRSVAGGIGITLSIDEIVPRNLVFTGALTASIAVAFPLGSSDAGAQWTIHNNTTNAFSLTVQAASGGGTVVCAQGKKTTIVWDGTNLKAAATDAAAMGLAAAGANSDITSLAGLTGGITGTGTINFDKIQGNNVPLAVGRLTKTYPSDANYTASAAEAANPWIELNAGVVTAPRNFVLPLAAGAIWFVVNNSGQTITFIGASGSGVAVATGKAALIAGDGTNIRRFGADV